MISTYHTAELAAEMLARLSMPEPNSGCYLWLGKIGTGDYAYISYREGKKRFHRKAATVALELAGLPRPEGMEVSHKCDNRACVNPNHLIWETHTENMQRREWSPKGQRYVLTCPHCGGPKEQTGKKRIEWICRPCRARRSTEWRAVNPGYQADYDVVNRDRINLQRRDRRHQKAQSDGAK